ncbi:MAG: conserved rane protein of unknown function [Francisellaceae bacterium]|nr:conserved rane protein of unknown function [Francisellaceae bacterium]
MSQLKLPRLNLIGQLVLVFLAVFLFGHFLSLPSKQILYSISLSLKECLLVVLPIIIFGCIFNCMLDQKGRALSFIAAMFVGVTASNLLSTLVGYSAGIIGYNNGWVKVAASREGLQTLSPLWDFPLTIKGVAFANLIDNKYALIVGLIAGLFFSFFPNHNAQVLGSKLNRFTQFFLKKLFIPILPIFALGFIVKMQHEGILTQVATSYLPIMLIILITNILYLGVFYIGVAGGNLNKALDYIKTVLPSGLMGFSTMSSLAALPLTLNAADKNSNESPIAKAVVPATANIHLIGNSIATPIIAMIILLTFGKTLPDFATYFNFAIYFVLAKFAVAAVPGGSILVMIPILESYLGFNNEMSALITTLYILVDPIITAGNVMGNGAFAILFSKLFGEKNPKNLTQ